MSVSKEEKKTIQIITGEPGRGCSICGRHAETRMGVCWECAEAESIILEGKDMYDDGNTKTAMEKLKMLIKKGWRYGK